MSNVSMVDGHIDPSYTGSMTPQEAIQRIKQHNEIHSKNERFAIYITEALNMAVEALEKQIPKKPMTQFEKLKQMNTDEAAAFISALADSCKDVARYGNQTVPYLVKLLLECEVEEE